jgi:hypothetical protein
VIHKAFVGVDEAGTSGSRQPWSWPNRLLRRSRSRCDRSPLCVPDPDIETGAILFGRVVTPDLDGGRHWQTHRRSESAGGFVCREASLLAQQRRRLNAPSQNFDT